MAFDNYIKKMKAPCLKNSRMNKESLTLMLSVVCGVASVISAFFTTSIALGLNEKWKSKIQKRTSSMN